MNLQVGCAKSAGAFHIWWTVLAEGEPVDMRLPTQEEMAALYPFPGVSRDADHVAGRIAARANARPKVVSSAA